MIRVLLGVDLALVVGAAALWIGAAVVGLGLSRDSAPRRPLVVLALAVAGALAVVARAVIVAFLSSAGWWFVGEKVALALPLAVVTSAVALALACRELTTARALSVRAAVALFAGAYGSIAAVIVQFVVGYPLGPVATVVTVGVVALAIVLTGLILSSAPRRAIGGTAALLALSLVASAGWAWAADRAAWSQLQLAGAHHAQAAPPTDAQPTVSVTDLRTPAGEPDERFELTAQQEEVALPSGRVVDAWTFGSLPGPELRVTQGDLVEVMLANLDVAAGVTIHWHGYDLPNGEDGVAGVTQDAVLPGETFTYRFVADDPGTYWFHSHQASAEGVVKGLYGTLVVEPSAGIAADLDLALPVHSFGSAVLLGGSDEAQRVSAEEGDLVRLRLINTDQETQRFALTGVSYEVVAADGRDITGADEVTGEVLRIPAGGRLDLEFRMPATPVTLTAEAAPSAPYTLVTARGGDAQTPDFSAAEFDLLDHGTGGLPDIASPTVRQELVLDRGLRVLDGIPSLAYTVNGAVFPNIAPTTVSEGDVVIFTVANRSTESHPMHPHGHHVLVLSRNGETPRTALWLDTIDVQPGEVWVFALVADNPGIWMDHCHNLEHAAQGMMFSLSYTGVTSPFSHGGEHGNRPE